MTPEQQERLAELTARRSALEHTLAQQHVDAGFRLRMEAVLESLNQQVREALALRTLRRRDWRMKGRHQMKRLTLSVLFLGLFATFAQAQSVCPINSSNAFTGQDGFVERCGFNPYPSFASKVNSDGRICSNDGPLGNAQTILSISEGTLGTPDHDLGYIILTNPTMDAQQVTVELMFRGDNKTTYVERVTLDGLTSKTIGLHEQPIYFGCGARLFSTTVYFERTGSAELKIYGLRDPAHPLAFVTVDKDGLPLPNATR